MAKGENIFRRRDGRWEARYSKGRELSGKIKYGYCYGKTYREAKEKAEKCKAALASGNPLPTSKTQNLLRRFIPPFRKPLILQGFLKTEYVTCF